MSIKYIKKFISLLAIVFVPQLACSQSSYSPNAANYFSPNGTLSEVVLKRYLARSLFMTRLVDITPLPDSAYRCEGNVNSTGQAEYNRWLFFINSNHPKIILGMSGIWSDNVYFFRSWCDDFFPKCSTVVDAIHNIDSQIICEAALDEWVNPDLGSASKNYNFQIPGYVVNDLDLPGLANSYFEAVDMRRTDAAALANPTALANCPDITKDKMIAWYYWLGTKYINAGFESIRIGQGDVVGFNDTDKSKTWKLFTALRKYAKTHGRRNFVLISGGTEHPYYPAAGNNQLLYDFQTARLNAQTVTSAEHGILSYGNGLQPDYHDYAAIITPAKDVSASQGILGHSPPGTSPQGWTTAHNPFIVEIDNSVSDVNSPVEGNTGYGFPWGWDESTWFSQQSELYRNHWLQYAWHRAQCMDPNGYLAINGRRPRAAFVGNSNQNTSPSNSDNYYRAYDDITLPYTNGAPKGYNQEATIKAIWDNQERTPNALLWSGDFKVLRSSSLAAITGRRNYGDFNGDGLTDVLETADKSKGQYWAGWRIYLYNAANNSYELKGSGGSSPSWGEHIYVGDFDGDRWDDIIYTADRQQGIYWQGWEMRKTSANGSAGVTLTTINTGSFPSWGETLTVGRFDNDTKADLLVTTNRLTNPSGPEGYTVLLATNGFTSSNQSVVSHAGSFKGSAERLYAGDFNGDGLDDILVTCDRSLTPDAAVWNGYRVYHCTGGAADVSFEKKAANSWPSWGEKFALGDWNQDGKCDFTVATTGDNWGSKTYLSNDAGTHFIYAFKNNDIQNVEGIYSWKNLSTTPNLSGLQVIKGDDVVTYTAQYCDASSSGANNRTAAIGPALTTSIIPSFSDISLGLTIFPNPAAGVFTVHLPSTIGKTALHLTLWDVTGRQIWAQDCPAVINEEVSVNIGNYSSGLYTLRIQGANGFYATQRIMLI